MQVPAECKHIYAAYIQVAQQIEERRRKQQMERDRLAGSANHINGISDLHERNAADYGVAAGGGD